MERYGEETYSRTGNVDPDAEARKLMFSTPYSKTIYSVFSQKAQGLPIADFSKTLDFRRKPVHNFTGENLEVEMKRWVHPTTGETQQESLDFSGNETFLIKQSKLPDFLEMDKKRIPNI
jgi:hypothetical protein